MSKEGPPLQRHEQKSTSGAEREQAEEIKQHFGHCFEISKIDNGDQIPVGGSNFLASETDIKVTGDFEQFKPFFSEAHKQAAAYKLPELRKWLNSQDIDCDEKLFATLFAFTRKFEETYPDNPEKENIRRTLYSEQGKKMRVSEVFDANVAECAEIAALAQAYLQQEGVSSSYFSGDVLWNRDQEFSEAHSFVVIREGDTTYIYDPTNPTNTTIGKYPSIYKTDRFDDEIARNEKRFLSVQNLLTKKEVLYGTNISDGANVEAKDIMDE